MREAWNSRRWCCFAIFAALDTAVASTAYEGAGLLRVPLLVNSKAHLRARALAVLLLQHVLLLYHQLTLRGASSVKLN